MLGKIIIKSIAKIVAVVIYNKNNSSNIALRMYNKFYYGK